VRTPFQIVVVIHLASILLSTGDTKSGTAIQSGDGVFQSGDGVFLRSRGNMYLNTPAGVGPKVVMSPDHLADPQHSDEIWWIERVAGNGPVRSGDMVFLRSRGNMYLNTPAGVGPKVVMSPNHLADPQHSDEIWWIERVAGNGP